jgi:hypothetical protein
MKGYEQVDMDALRDIGQEMLIELGFDMARSYGRLCSLCPRDGACSDSKDCDAGTAEVWVPEHVSLILKLHKEN